MSGETAFSLARGVFGLFYFGTGIMIVLGQFGLGEAPRQPNAAAQAFTDALTASRFMDPLIALSYLVGGGALLIRRTAPLGIVILAPPVIAILMFHLVLSGQWIWGPLNAAWLAVLAWHFRAAYVPLWNVPQLPS